MTIEYLYGQKQGSKDNPLAAKINELVDAINSGTGGAVSSVFTRTGAVTAQSGDYTAAQVSALAATAAAGGDLTGNYPNPTLATAGPGATGPIGSTSVIPQVTIDAKGRVTALGSAAPTLNSIATANGASASISANSQKITNLATPTATTDACTKAYADSLTVAGNALFTYLTAR